MKVYIDVYYYTDKDTDKEYARTVAGIFETYDDITFKDIVITRTDNIALYEPGNFYKEDITHVVRVTNEWDGHKYWAGYYAYIRNSKGDNYFRDPTRLRLDDDDYKKLRKYLPIINNI